MIEVYPARGVEEEMDHLPLDDSQRATGIGPISTLAFRAPISTGGLSWDGNRTKYTYDGLNRLTGYYQDGVGQSYAYDDYGNLINLAGLSLLVDTDTNRLTTVGGVSVAGEWDLRGNLTKVPSSAGGRAKRLWYSAEDRLMKSKDITSEQTWRYAYDSSGERVAAWQRDSQGQLLDVTISLRDEGGRVLSDWLLIPGVSFGPKRDYLYAGDRLALQLDWSEGESPVRKFVAVDHLNSTRAVVSDDGGDVTAEKIDYYPFGGFITGDPVPDTTHLFTGHERDTAELASNLDYLHARYFSSNLGRFLSVDPVGGEVGSSQSWNRYSYVENNPLAFLDADGKVKLRAMRGYDMNKGRVYSYDVKFEGVGRVGAFGRVLQRIGQAIKVIEWVDDSLNVYTNDTSHIPRLDTPWEKAKFERDLREAFEDRTNALQGLRGVYSSESVNQLDAAVDQVIDQWRDAGIDISQEEADAIRGSYDANELKRRALEKQRLTLERPAEGEDEEDVQQ